MAASALLRVPLGSVNAYVLRGHDGLVVVDTGNVGLTALLFSAITRRGWRVSDIRLIVLTHSHIDHVGGLPALRRRCDAPVALHHTECDDLARGLVRVPAGTNPTVRHIVAALRPPARHLRLPGHQAELPLNDSFDLRPFGLRARLLHTPGHTIGSMALLTDDGDALAGDNIINTLPFGLGPYYPPMADLEPEVLPSWRKLMTAGAKRIYPGHGGPLSVARLAAAWQRRSALVGSVEQP